MNDLKVGMQVILNGQVHGVIEELGVPEDLPNWKGWIGDEPTGKQLLHVLRRFDITQCASIGVGNGEAILIGKQQGQWRLFPDGTPINIELKSPVN
jgi:hypothetical protein